MGFPYLRDDGRICCSSELNCCAKCKQRLADEAAMRIAEARAAADYTPPNPYDGPLEAMRRAARGE